jgi:uncharacterized membrane protein
MRVSNGGHATNMGFITEGGTMTIATDSSRRYGSSMTERRIGSYSSAQSRNRRWTDTVDQGTDDKTERRARGLGWFSVGLGLAQIGAPRTIARLIGVDDSEKTRNAMFAIGLREITSGIGILSRPRPAGWVWSRVGGDLMDLALLGKAVNSDENDKGRVAATTAAVLGVTVLDFLTSKALSQKSNGRENGQAEGIVGSNKGIRVKSAITVARPVSEVYGFWRNFENLPRFMSHLESVQVVDDKRSHWTALGPAGIRLEWDAQTVEDRPNELISWRSLPGGQVETSGYVRFRPAPGNRGTEIVVEMRYDPPGGVLGASIAKLFGESGQEVVTRDLQAFKNVLEVGEVVHSDSSIYTRPHPARPPTDEELEKARLLNTETAVR